MTGLIRRYLPAHNRKTLCNPPPPQQLNSVSSRQVLLCCCSLYGHGLVLMVMTIHGDVRRSKKSPQMETTAEHAA